MISLAGMVLLGYLLGSASLAPLIARAKGLELSGSVGAAGVAHLAGKGWGVASGLFDFAKGLLPVLLARELGLGEWTAAWAGITAVCGHNWPLYFGFRGGRGLNTITGATALLLPRELLIAFPLGILVGYAVRHSPSITEKVDPIPAGAAGGLIGLLLLAWLFAEPIPFIVYALAVALLPMFKGLSDLAAFIARLGREG